MSLIHWWPLNGDTQDKITNTQLTNNGATIVDNGKIGRCYTFNGSANLTISYPSLNTLGSNPTKFSFALWIKINSTWTGWGQVFTIGRNGGAWTDIRIGFDVASDKTGYFTVSDGSSAASYSGPKHALTVGKWHHVVATFDNKKMKLFINGQPASTPQATASVLPNLSSDTFIAIGGNGGENCECDMNDVRVYDHVLSEAEVKELSKALVVHYTFDDRLAESTTNLVTGITSGGRTTVDSSGKIVTTAGQDADTYFYLKLSKTLETGKVYTISCTGENIGENTAKTGKFFKFGLQGQSNVPQFVIQNGHNSLTFTATATQAVNSLLLDDTARCLTQSKFYNFQLEEKDHATVYTLTSRAGKLCNETGLTQPNTSDNVSLTTDSKSGTLALKCQGNTQIICTNTGDVTQGVTASFWVKCSIPSDNRLVFADNNSKIAFGFYNNGQAIITCAGYAHACVSNIRTNWNTDWNHIIVRKTSNGAVECYINGVKQNLSGSQEWTHGSTNGLSIGCRYSGGWTSHFTGLIDDFRLYHTCLTDNDVQRLYQTRASIMNSGSIECLNFVEESTPVQVRKNYSIAAEAFQEFDGYELLEYIASTGNQYIDTGYYWTTEKATIKADLEVTTYKASTAVFGSEERYSGSSRYFAHILHAGSANANFSSYIGTSSVGAATVLTKGIRYQLDYVTNGDKTFSVTTTEAVSGKQASKSGTYSGTILTRQNSTQTSVANRGNIFIFSNHNAADINDGGAIQHMGGMKLYRFRMYDNDICVRDFYPCKRASDGAIGLLDLINGGFYKSPNGKAFEAGKEKTFNTHFTSEKFVRTKEIIEI